jgi:hypothetical protein
LFIGINHLHKQMEKTKEDFEVSRQGKGFGLWFSSILFKIACFLQKQARNDLVTDEENLKYELESRKLLNKKEIREAICFTINQKTYDELNMETVVRIVVNSIGDEEFRKKNSIGLDPKLFAFISYEILQNNFIESCGK